MKQLYILVSAGLAWLLRGAIAVEGNTEMIVSGTDRAPYQYRILMPYVVHALEGVTLRPIVGWLLWFLLLVLFALLVDEHGRRYYDGRTVVPWVLAGLATVPPIIDWQLGHYPINAMFEAVVFAAALLLIQERRWGWMALLTAVASLNRETAIFIPLLAFAVTRNPKVTVLLGVVWVAVYGAIRLYYGPLPRVMGPDEILVINTQPANLFNLALALLFFGWLLYYAAKGYPQAPTSLRRAAWVIPPYLAAVAIFGVWAEWRLMLTLYPMLLPLAMGAKLE